MIVNRNTTHEALHRAGATLVKSVAPGVFDVEPPINENLLPALELDAAKAAKVREFEQTRKAAEQRPVTVAGKVFPAEYRELISNMASRQSRGKPIPATLRGADGTPVTLNAVLIGQLDDAIAAAIQAQWDKYWLKFDAVMAAQDAATVDAVTW